MYMGLYSEPPLIQTLEMGLPLYFDWFLVQIHPSNEATPSRDFDLNQRSPLYGDF